MKLSLQEQLQIIKTTLLKIRDPIHKEKHANPLIKEEDTNKSPKNSRKECPYCKIELLQDKLKKHIKNTHPEKPRECQDSSKNKSIDQKKNPSSSRVDTAVQYAEIVASKKTSFESKKNNNIELLSKRGTRISERVDCSSCGYPSSPVWRYSKSNYGIVHLCQDCKTHIWDKSFGKVDAMQVAFSGGRFEGNRSKH